MEFRTTAPFTRHKTTRIGAVAGYRGGKGDVRILERTLTIFSLATVVVPLLVAAGWWVARAWPALDSLNRLCLTAYGVESTVALTIATNRWRRRGVDRSAFETLLLEPAVAGIVSILLIKRGGGVTVWLVLTGLNIGLAITGRIRSDRARKRGTA